MTAWLPVLIPGALPLAGILAAAAWYGLGGRELAAYLSLRRRQAAGVAHLIAIAQEQAAAADTMPMPAIPEPSRPAERRLSCSPSL